MPITISNNTITGVQAGGMDGVPFAAGTKLLFQQTTAPVGWTKDVTHDNKSMRVVSGTVGSGGTVAFTTAFASQAVSGSVGNTTLSEAQMPSHSHGQVGRYTVSTSHTHSGVGGGAAESPNPNNGAATGMGNTTNTGGSTAHNHSFTGTAINMAVQYVDVIIATKD